MKVCKKCNIEKDYESFPIRKGSKDGYRSECRECTKLYRKSKNYVYESSYSLEEKKEYNKQYIAKNKEKLSIRSKIYYIENKTYICNRIKNNKNHEYQREYSKNYRIENKEYFKRYRYEYEIYRRNTDSLYKLTSNIRTSISGSIKKNGYIKESKTTEIIGLSFKEFKIYLESRFEIWMNWDNYGKYNGQLNYGWDIDHIIPISSAETEIDIYKLNYYTNLQPLCSYTNRYIKKNKIEYEQEHA